MVAYFTQMKVLSVAAGKNHMLAITDNGVSRKMMIIRLICLLLQIVHIIVKVSLYANDL